jgi:hypothetical protein
VIHLPTRAVQYEQLAAVARLGRALGDKARGEFVIEVLSAHEAVPVFSAGWLF